jgi:hypothetical protein
VLKDNERRGRIAAVHCRGGIGRTGKSALHSQADDRSLALTIQWAHQVWSLAVGSSNQRLPEMGMKHSG